jgi:dTDP-4-amino-4,6-dideoxygalactose transaminase
LIEDAACAAGSSYHGKKIGSHSDLVCFSFHPRKVISTGDGGMVTTNNDAYAERMNSAGPRWYTLLPKSFSAPLAANPQPSPG